MSEVADGPDDSTRSALEKTLLWKLDLHILPIVTLIYLASFLDRANIGNARIAGLEKDLNLHGTQYILCEIPSNIFLKKFRAHRWLGFLIAAWGIVTTLTGLIHTFTDLVAIRLLLGLCEGGLVPGVVASFSGAFGGLLASAIIQMNGVGNIAGWRWFFILEGIATVILSIVTVIALPSDIRSAKFLTKEEREYALWRLEQDCELPCIDDNYQAATQKEAHEHSSVESEDLKQEQEVFEWRELRRGLFDVHALLTGLASFGFIVSLYSFSYFFPTIVTGLGYSGVQAQLHTVLVAVAFLSDHTRLRDPFIIALLPLTMMGYIIAIVATTNKVRYIGACFIAAGTTSLANNTSGHYKRATAIAVNISFANAGGFVATFIYTPEPDQGPRYKKGHTVALGLVVFGWVVIVAHLLYCLYENKARREGRRDTNIAKYKALRDAGLTRAPIGDRHPKFMFTP
ncbi:MFS general substrate transporter [Amanita muscaria]